MQINPKDSIRVKQMTTNTSQKLRREANSLLGLSIINMLSSAMILAFGASTLFPNIITMFNAQRILLPELAWAILGGIGFAIGIRWLVATAEVLEIHSNQIKQYGGSDGIRDINLLSSAVAMPYASFSDSSPLT